MNYQELSPESRVWIYQAHRLLTPEEAAAIQADGEAFIKEWSAHGALLKADIKVFHGLFVVFFADESAVKASGCSIDSSVHWIKSIQQKYQIDLLDRMTVAYRKNATAPIALVHINEMDRLYDSGEINDDTLVYNNMVVTKREFMQNWEIPLRQSWHRQRLAT